MAALMNRAASTTHDETVCFKRIAVFGIGAFGQEAL
jgi:hypothetical protein